MLNVLVQTINMLNEMRSKEAPQEVIQQIASVCDQIYRDIVRPVDHFNDGDNTLTYDEKQLIVSESTLIPAVRAVRERRGQGLADAKRVCDIWRAKHMIRVDDYKWKLRA